MPFMYPEQLRELRAQYPNTQFDGHGQVTGGMPLDQYNAQTANPAIIPASVRTYSQFDPATNSWVRHTNGTAPVQSSTPASTPSSASAQGTPINFQQVLGYTPAGFEGATLNVGGKANTQPRQVMRPLARGNARVNVKPKISDYSSDDAILRVADIPPEVTLSTKAAAVNMSPDHRVPTPYVSNETLGLAGYNPNIAKTSIPLTMNDQHNRSAVLLGTLPNSNPSNIPSIMPWIGSHLSSGLARFALDD